jgi:hypothetical protein
MTMYEFKGLDRTGQIEAVCKHGVRLGEREEGNYAVVLFQINYFYVEVLYESTAIRIEHLRSFADTLLLGPYLKNIDIAPLIGHL